MLLQCSESLGTTPESQPGGCRKHTKVGQVWILRGMGARGSKSCSTTNPQKQQPRAVEEGKELLQQREVVRFPRITRRGVGESRQLEVPGSCWPQEPGPHTAQPHLLVCTRPYYQPPPLVPGLSSASPLTGRKAGTALVAAVALLLAVTGMLALAGELAWTTFP